MRIETIRERASRIRWPNKAISAATGLPENTIGRTLSERTSPNLTTFEKIEAALEQEEIALRDHLLRLHPLDQDKGGAA